MSEGRRTLSFGAFQDVDAGVWVATSAEGRITTEAPSRDELMERLKVIVPNVLESRLGLLRAVFRSSSIGKSRAPWTGRN